jgi:hypothetical protein
MALWLLLVFVLACPRASADDMPIPAQSQVPILLKILTYDRKLEESDRDVIRIGVLYAPHNRQSSRWRSEICEQLEAHSGKTINGTPHVYEAVAYTSIAKLNNLLSDREIDILYISGGLSEGLGDILALCREHGVFTMSGVAEYVDAGICVALGIGDGKPEIVVDLPTVRAVGSDLKASLLRLCRVIR